VLIFINKHVDLYSLQDTCIQHALERVQIDSIDSVKRQQLLKQCMLTTRSKQFAIRIDRDCRGCPLFFKGHLVSKRDPDRPIESSGSISKAHSIDSNQLWRRYSCSNSSGRKDWQAPQDRSHWKNVFFQTPLWKFHWIPQPRLDRQDRPTGPIGPPRTASSSSWSIRCQQQHRFDRPDPPLGSPATVALECLSIPLCGFLLEDSMAPVGFYVATEDLQGSTQSMLSYPH